MFYICPCHFESKHSFWVILSLKINILHYTLRRWGAVKVPVLGVAVVILLCDKLVIWGILSNHACCSVKLNFDEIHGF